MMIIYKMKNEEGMMLKRKIFANVAVLLTALMSSEFLFADNHERGHSMGKMSAVKMKQKTVSASGVIKELVVTDNKIKVIHDPIKAWNMMSGMQMTFWLGPNVDMSTLTVGQQIDFMLENPSIGKYVITEIMLH